MCERNVMAVCMYVCVCMCMCQFVVLCVYWTLLVLLSDDYDDAGWWRMTFLLTYVLLLYNDWYIAEVLLWESIINIMAKHY
jgi:hypothetical protein